MKTSRARNIILFFSALLIELPLWSGTWGTPTNISAAGQDGELPSVGIMGTSGVAVWQGYNEQTHLIRGSTLIIGQVWTAPFSIANTLTDEAYPRVGIYTGGGAVAVWHGQDANENYRIYSSQRLVGLVWTTPVTLSAAGGNAWYPKIGVSAAGIATAAWFRYNANGHPVVQTATSILGGVWSAATDLSDANFDAFDIDLAVNAGSDAVVAWSCFDGSSFVIQAARRVSGSWTAAVTLSAAGQDAIMPKVAIDTAGNAFVIWSRFNGSHLVAQVSRFSGGAWSAPVTLSSPGQNAFRPAIAVSGTGNGMAVWSRYNGSNYIIQASSYNVSGGTWSAAVNVSSSGASALAPQVVMDSSSNAVAVWTRSDGTNIRVQGSDCPFGGAWTTPVNISTAGQDAIEPSFVTNTNGNALAIWSFFQNDFYRVQTATYTP